MGEDHNSLESTPSWAIAGVCAVLIIIALLIDHGLHLLTRFFERRKLKTLNQALYHIKTELRNLGFMSMLLTIAKEPISRICITKMLADSLVPCKGNTGDDFFDEESSCGEGKVPLVSTVGTGQLQLLIFALAGFHAFSCLATFLLGEAMLNRWKSWEEETKTMQFQLSNGLNSPARHPSGSDISNYGVCSIRQLIKPVSRADYYALRRGFLMVHFNKDLKFDFQKFLSRSLDHDFAVVVRISLWIWMYAILMICFNASEFHSHYWPSLIPLLITLVVGMKLEVIITTMCRKSSHEAVVSGTVSVTPDNSLFWFHQPRLLLHIIHFILIQNSFQLAYVSWSWSCFHKEIYDIVFTIIIGVLVHFLCAYVTLPLYALVAQMGSSMRESIFADRVIEGLRNWHRTAKRNLDKRRSYTLSSPSTDSRASLFSEKKELAASKERTQELETSSKAERLKSIEEKKRSIEFSGSSAVPFSVLSTAGSSSSSMRTVSAQEFRFPSGRLELLEVQKVVEEIIQSGGSNMPHTGEMSFNLWREHSKESSSRSRW